MPRRAKAQVVIGCVFLLASMAASSWGSGNPHTWIRDVLIGYDTDHYYVLSMVHDKGHSYYEYEQSVFLDTYTFAGERVERIQIRHVVRRDTTATGTWTSAEKLEPPPEIAAFFVREGLRYAFPSWPLHAHERVIVFEPDGMFWEGDESRTLIVDGERLSRLVPHYRKQLKSEYTRPRLTNVYDLRHIYLLEIQTGSGNTDVDAAQSLVPLDKRVFPPRQR